MPARALREGRIDTIADRLPVHISYTLADGRVLYANPALLADCGRPRDTPQGLHERELLGPEVHARIGAARRRVLAGENVTFHDSHRVAGQLRHYEVTFLPDRDAAGGVQGYFGIGYDITDRVQREATVATREQQLQGIFDTMAEGLVIHDQSGRLIEVNPAAEQLIGLSRAQLLAFEPANPHWDCLHPDGTTMAPEELPVLRTLRTGQPTRNALMGIRIAGQPVRWLSVNANPLYRSPGSAPTGVVGTFADVTELQQSVQRIRELAQRLESVREQERHELALTLHEGLAQDLFAMRLALGNLRRELGGADPGLLDEVTAALDRCMADTRQLAGSLKPTGAHTTPIGDAIGQHARYFEGLSKLRIRLHESGAPVVTDDSTRLLLFRASQEALSNAARHAGATQVDIHLEPHGEAIELRIVDDGRGLAPGALDKPGSLGLLGLRERARAAGGTLDVESGARGTTIRLRLPMPAATRD